MKNDFLNAQKAKSGVSLIVVLLFMMIATIAATATYKWITSESRSSGSRMLQREAYQSAVAGIENARSWIAWNANDAGALIKQYLDGGKVPVNIDKQLRPLQRAGQKYNVWLTGVNTESSTYKLKILSEGEARNGVAKHSEIAILNVDGLYQVKIPTEKSSSVVDFDYAYFGGSTNNSGNMNPSSMLINGNWSGNPNTVSKNFVVTGNASLSGDNLSVAGTTCIGGNLSTQNGFTGRDLYVAGNASNFNGTLYGDAYIEGDFQVGSACGSKNFAILGNVTLNGKLDPGDCSGKRIEGNLCTSESGQLVSSGGNNPFTVYKNVWMPGNQNVWYSGWGYDNYDSYNKIVLGNSSESQVYIKTAHPWKDYDDHRNQKTFTETSGEKRTCSQYTSGQPQCLEYAYWGWWRDCAKWGTSTACGNWTEWNGTSYSPYQKRDKKDNLYYLFYVEDGVEDVEFKTYNNTYWNASIGAYYVGGKPFYDMWDVWNQYRYGNVNKSTPDGLSPYCKTQNDYSNSKDLKDISAFRPVCNVNPWFKSEGTVSRNLPADVPFSCADDVKASCDSIWEKKPGCDGSNYKVDDMLVTAYSKFESYANKDCAKNITVWSNDMSAKMNKCYEEITKDSDSKRADENLYNGYLVVKVSSNGLQNPSEVLKGKFIIIVTNSLGQQNLPSTTSDSYVFLYLSEGGSQIQPQGNGPFNYFIYTEKDVGNLLFNNVKLSGSVYAAASTCAKITNMTIKEIDYNKGLLDDLANSGIVCNNDGSSCGGSNSGGSSTGSSSSSVNYGGTDPHYISMAPQLGVSLETQYENKEKVTTSGDTTRLAGSYIVLPRVIYLPSNPAGKLEDYYNVLGLNGASVKKSDVRVNSCASSDASLNVSGTLYSATTGSLTQGVYTCKTSASSYEDVPFWVVIGSESGNAPTVYFEKSSQEIASTQSQPDSIRVVVPKHTSDITLNYSWSGAESAGWNINSVGGCSVSSGKCSMTLSAAEESIVTLFTVTTSGASSGTFVVYLDAGSGYQIGAPSMAEIHIQSGITVVRKDVNVGDIKTYCDLNPSVCPDEDLSNWPVGNCNAGTTEWVRVASGVACSPVTKNEQWNCISGGTGEVRLEKGSDKSGCIVIVPDSSIKLETMENGKTYPLRAGIFAKKQTLTVGFTGDVGGKNPKINVRIERSSSGTKDSYCDYGNSSDHTCKIDVFYGDYVTLSLDTSSNDHDNFNYWKCENASGNCPTDILSSTTFPAFTIRESEYTMMAHFGESDKHCFFDEFTHPDILCGSAYADEEYCVADYAGGNSKAKWLSVSGAKTSLSLENGNLSVPKNSPVVVMSSVNAGLYGTLKALMQVTRETSSHDKSSDEIRKTGLLLRATKNASEYLMLNVYANKSGNLEATYCIGNNCKSKEFLGGYSTVAVSSNAMVMVEAKLKQGGGESVDSLVVTAYKDSYYGTPIGYSAAFALSGDDYARLSTREHEYVGFALASEKVRLYGIGWKSEDYASECHDTYPTLKCSFSAVAENGFVPTGKSVKPWVGHSAWYSSKNCTEHFSYQGSDACGGSEYSKTSCGDSYTFSASGAGAHGYMDGENWIKTAFASLDCYGETATESLWNSDEANCGKFWTGKFTECSNHENLLTASFDISPGEGTVKVLESAANMRSAKLKVKIDSVSTGSVDFEVYFGSKDASGNLYYSQSVRVSRYGAFDFDIVQEMSANAETGFDPENVTGVYYKNSGATVRLASLTTECSNAISLSACRATYKSGSIWTIEADVSNTDKIESFTMMRTVDGGENTVKVECNAADNCFFDGQTAKLNFTDDRSPYQSEQGKSYAFHLSLSGNGGNTTLEKDCSVSPETIGKITASCNISKTSVCSGEGLPRFSASLDGCPAGGCAWKISSDNGKISETGSQTTYNSSFSGENTAGNPWEPGTYKIKLESANSEYPFDGCYEEFSVTEAKSSSSVEESSSSAAGGGSSSSVKSLSVTCGITSHNWEIYTGEPYESIDFYFYVKNNVSEESQYPVVVYRDSETFSSANLNSWSGVTAVSLGKLAKGSHTYSVRYNGEEICSSSIQIVSPLSCSVDKTKIGFGDSFTLTASYAGNCWNSSLSGNGATGANCGSSYVITPTAMGTQTYVYQVTNGSVGSAACTTSVAVSEVAPTVECPDAQTKSVGGTVAISPKTLTGCGTDNGCSYTVNDVNSQVGSGTIKNGEKFSFAGASSAGTETYTLNVSNSEGSAECNFDVTYEEGVSFNCNANNSTVIAKEEEKEMSANTCTSYTMDGATTLQIGCWYAPSTPVTIELLDCTGSVVDVSHTCGGWQSVPVGGTCTIYLYPQKAIKWKFNNW